MKWPRKFWKVDRISKLSSKNIFLSPLTQKDQFSETFQGCNSWWILCSTVHEHSSELEQSRKMFTSELNGPSVQEFNPNKVKCSLMKWSHLLRSYFCPGNVERSG